MNRSASSREMPAVSLNARAPIPYTMPKFSVFPVLLIAGGKSKGGDIAAMGYPLVDWAREQRQAIGAVAHEIGHCVGLPHPEDMADPTIMFGWWEFPAIGFQWAEREIVRASPFFSRRRGRHW